jgi:hypothetical protein
MRSVRVTRQLNRYSRWNRKETTLFSGHYLSNCSTLDIGVLGYIGILKHKEHSPEVWHIPPGTTCIYIYIYICVCVCVCVCVLQCKLMFIKSNSKLSDF